MIEAITTIKCILILILAIPYLGCLTYIIGFCLIQGGLDGYVKYLKKLNDERKETK
jgi:hypothetical protein